MSAGASILVERLNDRGHILARPASPTVSLIEAQPRRPRLVGSANITKEGTEPSAYRWAFPLHMCSSLVKRRFQRGLTLTECTTWVSFCYVSDCV